MSVLDVPVLDINTCLLPHTIGSCGNKVEAEVCHVNPKLASQAKKCLRNVEL